MASTTAPIPARVRWDRDSELPTSIEWGTSRIAVTGLRGVRDERHAYPTERGPRLTLDLDTPRGRAVLTWDARDRRWFLETIDERRAAA
jgi:hypothetical protein